MLCPSCGADTGDSAKTCQRCGAAITRVSDADGYIGRVINRKYRVEALIGEGGMGKVYRATQIDLDKKVVLKVLRQSLLSDQRTVARFQREAKAASRLNHPNSISVLEFGSVDDDGALFIAMEFVNGKDLHQILSKEWPLPEGRIVRIMSQVLSALADAHSAGVIHRDLKPENIMVEQRRGEPDFVKVLDFGIAKIMDSTGDEGPALTRAGFVCGTPEYMSPEQARGAQLDARSDLYAVGVILYQLTTGLLPFDSDSAVGFATKHLTEEPEPPTMKRPEAKISPGMERLILRAMAKDPNDRPQTAEQFRAELIAVDKERRAMAAARRSAGVLAPVPRKATPIEQQETKIDQKPHWGADETVRAPPGLLGRNRANAPSADRTRFGTGHTELTHLNTETGDVSEPGQGGMLIFKIVTIALVVISLGLAGFYVYQYLGASDDEPYRPPPNAPMQINQNEIDGDRPLHELEVPPQKRNAAEAERLERQGDEAVERGQLDLAATRYKEAFEKDPRPELSLKLGELYYQRSQTAEAKAWWARHLRDHPASKARAYVQQAFPDL